VHAHSIPSADETALRQEIAKTDYDRPDPTALAIYADWLDENGKNGRGHRRLVECIRAGALLSAWRVMATWEAGISPQRLAACLADLDGVLAADGGVVKFICGLAAAKAVKDHPQVDKADDYPALSAARLPAHFRTEGSGRILSEGAFNTAVMKGCPLYVFLDFDVLIATLSRIPDPVLA
jgi:uncharacterized protein (TIGR02996 family)